MKILSLLKSAIICHRIKLNNKNNLNNKKYILIPPENSIASCLAILPIYLGIYRAGYEIIVYTSLRSYKSIFINFVLGVNKFYFLNNIFFSKKVSLIKGFEFIDFHKYSEVSIKRINRQVDINNIKGYKSIKLRLDLAMKKMIYNFSNFNDLGNIYGVFFTDMIYNPQGPLYDYLRVCKPNIKIFNYGHGNAPYSLIINHFPKSIRHPHSPPLKTFNALKEKFKKKQIENLVKNIRKQITNYYFQSDWISTVGTSAYVKNSESAIESQFSEDFLSRSNGSLFIIFPQIYWDASSEEGVDIFENYKVWFEETINFILKNTNSNIIIKEHPAILSKIARESKKSCSEIKLFLKKFNDRFQHRYIYIEPDTNLSTLDLIQISDYILTVRGTPGVEAALFGKKVIFAGTGRYDNFEFGLIAKDINDYYQILKSASKAELKVDEKEKFYSALYLDIVLNKMAFKNEITEISYPNKAKSEPAIRFSNLKFKEINKNVKKLSYWLQNPSDFFDG